MKKLVFISVLSFCVVAVNAQPGKKVFDEKCVACHSIGGGNKIGPDLKGVGSRHDDAWLMKWIKSSAAMIKQKDPKALALFKKWKNMPMPDPGLTDAQIKDVIAYIKTKK